MIKMTAGRTMHQLAAGALLLFASLAHAQYVWIDEKGLKQYSDRPPPPTTPQNKVLKQPGQPSQYAIPVQPAAAAPAASAEAAAPKPKAPPTLAERNADFKKRQKDKEEADQKAAEENRAARAKQENCNVARNAKRELESGQRFSSTDAAGNRVPASEAEIADRAAQANKVLADCN